MTSSVLAVCVVHALRPDKGAVGTTGIDKRTVTGRIKVGRFGLYADVQADRKFHGGLDKAVYAYSAEDALYWQAQLGRELPEGWFGENLRLTGVDISSARVGDRWEFIDPATATPGVILEVTSPRQPCATFARWVGGADATGWVKRFTAARRPGAYLRVVKNGRVAAGDTVIVHPAADGAVPILDLV